ncbi:conserved hypothetical protein [Magnetospirillum sp. LM-5]|uniref:DUF2478 domain-containing protein n=1 Tax=Magnetospirillum sp. LM-5 TaxID=2681466 RepID=UPI0013817AE8|nr:DUF2478 domain-containing protein [Magnetospirillum sp. LM-5]CAA7619442.1 conserved hypothetical protein [Magnetospirillum sp. LM-5]
MIDPLQAPPLIGAIVYPPDRQPEALQAAFARALQARGFTIGGMIQTTRFGEDGRKTDMELTDVATGEILSIRQKLGSGSRSCSLDPAGLAEASAPLRRAIEAKVDLLLVNKFSKAEQAGDGLAAEMLLAMEQCVPLLTAVPAALVDDWHAFTGGRGRLLGADMASLWRWWGPTHLYRDLVDSVGPGDAKRVIVGLNWIMVEGPDGIGLAQTPERTAPVCRGAAGGWTGRPLAELAQGMLGWDPLAAAVGIAAANAFTNRFDLAALDVNGLDSLGAPDRMVVIGAFPGLAERLPGAVVIDRRPGPGQYPAEAADWLLPQAEAVIVTASALANRTLAHLLRLAPFARIALVGPGAPLSPRLFEYGIGVTSGLVATDPDGLARAVAEGAGARDLKRYCRQATLIGPEERP